MVPERGVPGELGFIDSQKDAHVFYTHVVPTPGGYVLRLTASEIPQVALTTLTVMLFGDPAARDGSASTPQALLTNPSDCSGKPPKPCSDA